MLKGTKEASSHSGFLTFILQDAPMLRVVAHGNYDCAHFYLWGEEPAGAVFDLFARCSRSAGGKHHMGKVLDDEKRCAPSSTVAAQQCQPDARKLPRHPGKPCV